MRILIISDTHGKDLSALTLPEDLPDSLKPLDIMLHAGDLESSEDEYFRVCAEKYKIPFCAAAGNNDYFSSLPADRVLKFCGIRLLLTHGHQYRVSLTSDILADEAAGLGCSIAVFGHTHRPYMDLVRNVVLLNPGSVSYPRTHDRRGSCIILDLEEMNGLTDCRAKLLYTDTFTSFGSLHYSFRSTEKP